jgi:hypothetical protein
MQEFLRQQGCGKVPGPIIRIPDKVSAKGSADVVQGSYILTDTRVSNIYVPAVECRHRPWFLKTAANEYKGCRQN